MSQKIFKLVLVALSLISLSACVKNSLPVINSLNASSTVVLAGDSVTLSWSVSNADSLTLTPGNIDVTQRSNYTVTPNADTTYTLVASNENGTSSKSVSVQLGSLPTISSFSASPDLTESGQNSTLSWQVSGATSIRIDQGVGDVTNKSSVTVNPTQSTVYTLTASNSVGSISKTAQITIGAGKPVIGSFTVTPDETTPNSPVTLEWSVSGDVESLRLLGDDFEENVKGKTSLTVSPSKSSTYVLVAENDFGETRAYATVETGDAAVITYFGADDTTVLSGSGVELFWIITGEPLTSLTLDGQSVLNKTSFVVTPKKTTTYELVATNATGSDTRTLTVEVGESPVISSFVADDVTVTAGASVELSWSVSDATSLSIDNSVGDVSGKTRKNVTVDATTTYTLTASNDFGSVTKSLNVVVGIGPSISSFDVDDATVVAGTAAVFSWTTSNATSLTMNQGVGDVTNRTNKTVTITDSATYTLTASNNYGTVTESIDMIVGDAPVITSFSASTTDVAPDSDVTFTWTTTGADSVSLTPGFSSVSKSGNKTTSVTENTSFVLTASNDYADVTQSIDVTVWHTLLIAGQSNASGRGILSAIETGISEVQMLGNDYAFKQAYEPVDDPTDQKDLVSRDFDDPAGHSFGVRLGKDLVADAETDFNVMLIPTAMGGTRVEEWLPTSGVRRSSEFLGSANLFESATYRAEYAEQERDLPVTAILWYQGETDSGANSRKADANPLRDLFVSRTTTVMNEFRDELSDVPIIYAQLSHRGDEVSRNIEYQDIREKQRLMETGAYNPVTGQPSTCALTNHYMVVTHDLPLRAGDPRHLSTAAQKILGDRIALAYREHVLGENVDGTGPRLVSITQPTSTTIQVLTTRTINNDSSYEGYFAVFDGNEDEVTISSLQRDPSNSKAVLITLASEPVGDVTVRYMPPKEQLSAQLANVVHDPSTGLPLPAFGRPVNIVSSVDGDDYRECAD